MEVISIEEKSFYELIDKIFAEYEEKYGKQEPQWITEQDAMKLLGIRSKTTLQKLRNNNQIRFSQPSRKIILYYKLSILEYLEKFANK